MGQRNRVMTETEWLACTEPEKMLEFRRRKTSKRKLRLFACACCRRVWHFISDQRSRSAVLVAEQFADGLVDDVALETAWTEAKLGYKAFKGKGPGPFLQPSHFATAACVGVVSKNVGPAAVDSGYGAASAVQMRARSDAHRETPADGQAVHLRDLFAWESERKAQADLLRDIFGNPYRPPPAVTPGWLLWQDATVSKLSQSIYDERAFDHLPVLADALEEAGCTDPDILTHCRQAGEHVRGCWVVDLLLGKL